MFDRTNGILFNFNNNIADSQKLMKIVSASSYKAVKTPLDSNSYRDANGVLHRYVVSNVPITVEFSTMSGLTDTEIEETWGAIIRNSFTVNNERKIHAKFWLPEINDYYTTDLYVKDPEFKVKEVRQGTNGYEVVYEPITFKFIGY